MGFQGSKLVFHGFRSFFRFFKVPSWFSWFQDGFIVFHGSRLISIVSLASRLVFHDSR